ncbi:MAG: serine--tRNA ligase [Candidatus Aenigmarchaeota archaeon ex4484_224]|nr:MAG: serine--tRNA ligase [Candidatus Aenigmarchaeota archaeon ex4484_224]
MIDIELIRKNPEFVRKNLERRQNPEYLKLLDEIIKVDSEWRNVISELNKLRAKRNEITKEIAILKKEGKDIQDLVKQANQIAERIKNLEEVERKLREKRRYLLLKLPNLLHESVPFGKDENDNVEIRRWGKEPKFDFEPKDHLTILKNLGLIDDERSAKIAGHGFFYLKEELALLDLALQRFAIDFLRKKGFKLIEPPFMMRRWFYEGVTSLEDFDEQLYKIENEDLYLIATSEHPMAAMFANEVLLAEQLPIVFTGVSSCFRKEVGAHGKYTKGLFRMHQFNKIEQFVFCLPEESWEWHEKLQENVEQLLQALGLHYRVVNVCTGDLGIVAAKKYDTEIWMADGKFREVASNSNCTDYQARRLNIRYREKEGAPVKGYVHTLNSTAIATSRTMIGIIEQFQQADGTVKIPRVLWKYTGFKELVHRDDLKWKT